MSTVHDVHTVTDVTLIHQRGTWAKDCTLKLFNESGDKLLREVAKEGNRELQMVDQVSLFIYFAILGPTEKNKTIVKSQKSCTYDFLMILSRLKSPSFYSFKDFL